MAIKRRFNLKRYIQVKNSKVIDTSLVLPHMECYFIEENDDNNIHKLFIETVLGEECYLGEIIRETDDLKDCVEGYTEFK